MRGPVSLPPVHSASDAAAVKLMSEWAKGGRHGIEKRTSMPYDCSPCPGPRKDWRPIARQRSGRSLVLPSRVGLLPFVDCGRMFCRTEWFYLATPADAACMACLARQPKGFVMAGQQPLMGSIVCAQVHQHEQNGLQGLAPAPRDMHIRHAQFTPVQLHHSPRVLLYQHVNSAATQQVEEFQRTGSASRLGLSTSPYARPVTATQHMQTTRHAASTHLCCRLLSAKPCINNGLLPFISKACPVQADHIHFLTALQPCAGQHCNA